MTFTVRFTMALLLVFSLPAPALAACLPPGCTAFPADAGFLNVHDFGAKGDGVTDDTKAINAALSASGGDTGQAFFHDRIVYFPDGVYRVSAPLSKRYANGHFASGAIMIGQSRGNTVIRLQDHAPGYDNSSDARAIVFTSSKLLDGSPTGGGKDYLNKGEGNDAYMNFIENMTVDAGSGNPGAIGIDYLANNMGAIRNVTVRAPAGSGSTGISLTRKWPGPALLEQVSVEGFAIGIDADSSEYGLTLEQVRLEKQRQVGLRDNHNMLAIHDLAIHDAPLAISNLSKDGLIVISGGELTAQDGAEAIANSGTLNLHDVRLGGYKTAFGAAPPAALDGIYDGNRRSASTVSWSLPVKKPPAPPADAPASWVSVGAFGAQPDTGADATASLRRAFASGASSVYFPHGTYLISENIVIPPSVTRIVGMTSTIHAVPNRPAGFRRDLGMFRAGNDAHPLFIEKIAFDNSYLGDQVAVEAMSAQPVILRDVVGAGVITLLRPSSGGDAFVEDSCCGTIRMSGQHSVWARQLNSEGDGIRIGNDGAPLWILGLKTEQDCTVLDNSHGAHTEILGGLIYITGVTVDPEIPAFRNTDARLQATFVEEAFHSEHNYPTYLIDSESGKTQTVAAVSFPDRKAGHLVPLLQSGSQ